VEEYLYRNGKWRDDERLIIFTEFKTTLDYAAARLKHLCKDDGTRIRTLYGGPDLDQSMRDEIKRAFNDPADPVRLLIATDVASEGLNLQETARLLLHWEVPWNPSAERPH
jgi:superfamily II DNA/RNA helicase